MIKLGKLVTEKKTVSKQDRKDMLKYIRKLGIKVMTMGNEWYGQKGYKKLSKDKTVNDYINRYDLKLVKNEFDTPDGWNIN